MGSPKNSCSKAIVAFEIFLQRCGASHLTTLCFLSQKLPVSWIFVTSRSSVVLFGTSLSAYALLNASRTAATYFDEKLCSRMNTSCAHKRTVFAKLSRNWRARRPRNQGGLDSSVTGEVESVFFTGRTCFWFHSWTVVRDCSWVAFNMAHSVQLDD
jgi:hypothetical protein